MSSCAILFAKSPQSGRVKTRLATHCDDRDILNLYRAFVQDCGETLAACGADLKVVAYAPADGADALRLLLQHHDFTWVAQPSGSLGQRLQGLVDWSHRHDCSNLVALGSDSPSLPVAYIDQALDLLASHQVVLGPCVDGGYYLIGQQANVDGLFVDIAWSTGAVLEQTIERIGPRSLGLLPVWYDVDTPTEAGFLKVHLNALAKAGALQGRHSRRVLKGLNLPLPS
ncbi:MAG: DUF2064 domain-containing protein [Candidatus Latescibacteria bacterium]|nr:DUF2064 domain-containing protein [Candidatus Latescibacterota bacterium]